MLCLVIESSVLMPPTLKSCHVLWPGVGAHSFATVLSISALCFSDAEMQVPVQTLRSTSTLHSDLCVACTDCHVAATICQQCWHRLCEMTKVAL